MNFHSQQSTCQCLHEEIGWSFFSLIWEYSEMLELICPVRQQLSFGSLHQRIYDFELISNRGGVHGCSM